MKDLFGKRRAAFLTRCLGYLRYVLNDHFVLVVMVILGFLAYQYSQLLQHFPSNHWPIYLLLAVVTILLFLSGRTATYLEAADEVFILPKEEQVRKWIVRSHRSSLLLWNGVLVVGELILLPLYLRLGWPGWLIGLYLLGLVLAQSFYLTRRIKPYLAPTGLAWRDLIAQESARQQSVLQFYALFTHVKGLRSGVKRRAYLDWLLTNIKRQQKNTWTYLYARAFLRAGDFFRLSLRLTVLAVLVLWVVTPPVLAVVLAALFNYLLWFQLQGLYPVYDYQYLTRLYPLPQGTRARGLQQVIRAVTYIGVLIEVLFCKGNLYVIALIVFQLFLNQVYLPIKSKKYID